MQPGRRGDHHRVKPFAVEHRVIVAVDRVVDIAAQHIHHETGPVAGNGFDLWMGVDHGEM